MTNKPKRIKIKETKKHYGDFEGKLEDIIASLQEELDAGWEGLESKYEWEYGCDERYIEFYFYKHREENDKEYAKRVKQLKKEKAKAKELKLQQLKKDLANLTDVELKQLGVK
jgi:hypothetical protein